MSGRLWQDLTTTDFAALDPEGTICMLPVAAIEQHGPHLPLATDSYICQGVIDRTLELMPDEASVLVLPMQMVGDSLEHSAFAGTLSLSAETLVRSWVEIGASVARTGLRKLLIVNSHGGQPQIVDIVGLRLRAEHGMLVVKANAFAIPDLSDLFDGGVLRHDFHGGAVETSIMLHLRPELVRLDAAEDFEPASVAMAQGYALLNAEQPIGFSWMTQDLQADGACGNARDADAERGEEIVDRTARALVDVIDDMLRFPLSDLKS